MNKFKFYRKQKEISQNGLADLLGLDQTTVGKWELGKSFPRISTLKKLSEIYGCTIDELFGSDSNESDIPRDAGNDIALHEPEKEEAA